MQFRMVVYLILVFLTTFSISWSQNLEITKIRYNESEIPTFIEGDLTPLNAQSDEKENTYLFFEQNRELYRMLDPRDELQVKRIETDDLDMTHVRLNQIYKGIEVYGVEMISHFTSSGGLRSVNGKYIPGIDVSVVPDIDPDQAERTALSDISSNNTIPHPTVTKPRLTIYPFQDDLYLAWLVEISVHSPPGRWEYFIHAKTGDVIHKANRIAFGQNTEPADGKTDILFKIEIGPENEIKAYHLDGEPIYNQPALKFEHEEMRNQIRDPGCKMHLQNNQSLPESKDLKPQPGHKDDSGAIPSIKLESDPNSRDTPLFYDSDSLTDRGKDVETSLLYSPNLTFYLGTGSANGYSYNSTTHRLDVVSSVQNNGAGAAGTFRVGWYLSVNTSISTSDYFVASSVQNGLSNGYYNNLYGSVDLDNISGLPQGTYYVGAVIDDLGQVVESNESDNAGYYTPTIQYTVVLTPNLTFYTGTGSVNGYSYNSQTHQLDIASSVQNNGSGPTGSFRLGWYLSTDTNIGSGDYLAKTATHSGLANGYYYNFSGSVDLDNVSGLPEGTYYVCAFIDDLSQIAESNESDNAAYYTPTIAYSNTVTPNLTFYVGQGSVNGYSYDSQTHQLDIASSVQNNGSDPSGNFRIGWYLSNDTNIGSEDYLVTTATHAGLPNGYYYNFTGSADVDDVSGLPAGTYFLCLYIDDLLQVTESDETDNAAYYTPEINYNTPDNNDDAIGTGIGVMGDNKDHIDTYGAPGSYYLLDRTRRANNNPHNNNGQMREDQSITTGILYNNTFVTLVDNDNVWNALGQASAVDAHVHAAMTYDFLLQLGRNSYDNNGSGMISIVERSDGYTDNAFWNGSCVSFCIVTAGHRSMAGAIDIVAHEWGHAVTSYASNLIYEKESGALNETFSDMMGTTVGFATGIDLDWRHGENHNINGDANRDLSNPHLYYQPDTYVDDPYWVDVASCTPGDNNDYCGVHTNCGVGNKMFYLLSEGGAHNGVSVTGIGIRNAFRIMYRANTTYWTRSTDFEDAMLGSISAADDLDNTGEWAAQTQRAWAAVKVGDIADYPEAPTSLSASVFGSSRIDLTWQDNATDETGYKVARKTGESGTYSVIATTGANTTNYSDTGLMDGVQYFYKIYAYNSAGSSSSSNESNGTTPMNEPTDLNAIVNASNQIDLTWQDNSSSEDGYRIERKIGESGIYSEIATVNADAINHLDTEVNENTTYFYRVQGYNALVNSAYSNESAATTHDPNSVEQASSDAPDQYFLSRNFPNPFNASTSILFGIPRESIVHIAVYNMSGQKVSTPVDNMIFSAGTFHFHWSGTDQNNSTLPSGVYFIRIDANSMNKTKQNFTAARKLVILK